MSAIIHLRNFIVLSVVLFFIHYIDAGFPSNRRILPTEVTVREGEDIQVHLVKVLEDETTCYARTPLLVNCNLKLSDDERNSSCDERLHYWSVNGACGFYISDVQKQDNGIWRLTSRSFDEKVVDMVKITILDKFDGALDEVIEFIKGWKYTLTFSSAENYCIIQNPYDLTQVIQDNTCSVEVPKASATEQGIWSAVIGVAGQVEEIVKTINVSIFYEHVKSGYTVSSDPKAIHMYCNYVGLESLLTMCRFANSAASQRGLRVREGMRKGKYGYYGNGLALGECGLTIYSPEEKDYGGWYCLISIMNQSPIITFIDVLKPADSQQDRTQPAVTPARTASISPVLTTQGNQLDLECTSNKPLSYCWFSLPNGTMFQNDDQNNDSNDDQNKNKMSTRSTFSNMLQDEENFWLVSCKITINNTKWEHNGTWTCHMGPTSPGLELIEEIHVRVAETPLAAIKKFVSQDDDRIIFRCKTVPRAMTLLYCRFQSPTGLGIHVDESVTEDNAIERDGVRYWYMGQGLPAGDCGLVIEPASPIHEGNWTCATQIEYLDNEVNYKESFDTIQFSYNAFVPAEDTPSDSEESNTAGIVSIIFGSLGAVLGVGLLIALSIKYKGRYWNQNGSERHDDVSLDTMPTDVSTASGPSRSTNRGDSSNHGSERHDDVSLNTMPTNISIVSGPSMSTNRRDNSNHGSERYEDISLNTMPTNISIISGPSMSTNRGDSSNHGSERSDDVSLNTMPTNISFISRPSMSTNRGDSSNHGRSSGNSDNSGSSNAGSNKSNNGIEQITHL